MWYLIDSTDDGSLCIVHEKNILQAGKEINVDATVTFFYQGKQYSGTVLSKNVDHDILNSEMAKVLRASKAKPNQPKKSVEPANSKRKIIPVNLFGVSSETENNGKKKTVAPKMSEAEKTRMRILKLNTQEAEKRSNAHLIKSQKKVIDNDPDWVDESSMDSVVDINSHRSSLRKGRNDIFKALAQSPSKSDAEPSPSKEDLKRQQDKLQKELELLRKQLQSKQEPTSSETTSNLKKKNKEEIDNKYSKRKSETDTKAPADDTMNADASELNSDKDIDSFDHKEESKVDDTLGSKDNNDQSNDSFLDLSDSFSSLETQLYGKGQDMTAISPGFYCKTNILTQALTSAHSVNHLMRRLLGGVFIPSKIQDCTVTGQSWHSGGQERLRTEMTPLHAGALKAIVEFSNGVAKSKKWKTIKKEKTNAVFAVRLTEIKKFYRMGMLKD